MGDLGKKNWIAKPDNTVEKKWLECQIQEKKSRICRLKQDIEDMMKGRIVGLEAEIMMLEKDVKILSDQYGNLDKTIDV